MSDKLPPETYDIDWYDDGPDDLVTCPRCNGDGSVICHCGGDLCVCDNHGDAPCPLCWEEGYVTPEKADAYLMRQREFRDAVFGKKEPRP